MSSKVSDANYLRENMSRRTLLKTLASPSLTGKMIERNEVSGYQSPTSGKITFNKNADPGSFGIFSDIITDCVPLEVVLDPYKVVELSSIANIRPYLHPRYLILNSTLEDYTEEQDEEDRENMSGILLATHDAPWVAGLAIQKSEAMMSAHAIAFIAWRRPKGGYKFAYYDSLAYRRGKMAFDYTDYAFKSERFEEKIEFIDLNQYCFKSGKVLGDFHCAQYVFNAEYCYLYALYFLEKWWEFGAKLHRATFRKTIKATYIVDPAKITRASTHESLVYRVTMMSFVCKSLLAFLTNRSSRKYVTNIRKNTSRIRQYVKDFQKTYGIDLLST